MPNVLTFHPIFLSPGFLPYIPVSSKKFSICFLYTFSLNHFVRSSALTCKSILSQFSHCRQLSQSGFDTSTKSRESLQSISNCADYGKGSWIRLKPVVNVTCATWFFFLGGIMHRQFSCGDMGD